MAGILFQIAALLLTIYLPIPLMVSGLSLGIVGLNYLPRDASRKRLLGIVIFGVMLLISIFKIYSGLTS